MTDNELYDLMCARYSYRDGNLYFKASVGGRSSAGKIVGGENSRGYRKLKMDGKTYSVHRIIYLMHHGYLPDLIDHIDRGKSNNRIENLRHVSNQVNNFNAGKYRTNKTSKYRGVSFSKRHRKWQAYITLNGKRSHLGSFETEEQANMARIESEVVSGVR
jgi:hypothetical protein